MRTRSAAVAALVVLALLAGCTDAGPEAGGDGATPSVPDMPWNFTVTVVDEAFKVTEPSIEVAPDGTIWITGPTGFTRGATNQDPTVYSRDHGLFESTDGGATWTPNTPIPTYGRDACPGGGDSDLAIAPDGAMFLVDLNLATVPIAVSSDGGATWLFHCQSNAVPVQDRQWVEASEEYVWVMANQLPSGPMMWRAMRLGTPADGLLFGPPAQVPISGPIERDPESGTLYLAGSARSIARSVDEGTTWTTHENGNENGNRGPFQNVAVDDQGNIFHTGAGSDGVWVAASADQGDTWAPTTLIRPYEGEYMFAWGAATGNGTFFVAWYGKPDEADAYGPADGWYLYAAQSSSILDGDANATLRVARVDPEPVTTKTICSGLGCDVVDDSRTRMLGDFFETAIDSEGRFVITYNRVSDDGEPILMFASGGGST